MIASYWAHPRTLTLWQLSLSVFAYVISLYLFLVARLAEVSVSPAKPLGYVTTEFALELDEISSMLRTVFHWYLAAVRTDKFFCFKGTACILLIHSCHAILTPSKVRFLAFKAHKVRINDHGVLMRLPKIRRSFILQLRITLLQLLKLQPIWCHFLYLIVKNLILLCEFMQLAFRDHIDPFFTERTCTKIKKYSWGQPFDLKSFFQAFDMENMATTTPNTGSWWQRLDITYSAVLIAINSI